MSCANLIGSDVPIRHPPRNLYASLFSILLKFTKSSFTSYSAPYFYYYYLLSIKSNISSSESFLISYLKSIIVSSFARAQTWAITSSASHKRIYKILKVARVMSYCLTSGSSSILGSPLSPISSHFFNKKKREGPVYNFNRKALVLSISMISFNYFLLTTPV